MFGEALFPPQAPWPLKPEERRAFVDRLISYFSKLHNRENPAQIERFSLQKEDEAFKLSTSYEQYRNLLLRLSMQPDKLSKHFKKQPVELLPPKQNNRGASETESKTLGTNKGDKRDRSSSEPLQEHKRRRIGNGSLLLSPLHYYKGTELSEVTSMGSSDRSNVAAAKVGELHKLGSVQRSATTISEGGSTSNRVAPLVVAAEHNISLEKTFVALKAKYKIPFLFLSGVVQIIEDDKVCPNELKRLIQHFAFVLELEKGRFVQLDYTPKSVEEMERKMKTILRMFRPMLEELVQWVEVFGHNMFQSEASYLSSQPSFSSEERLSNSNTTDLGEIKSLQQQSMPPHEKKQSNLSFAKSSSSGTTDVKQQRDSSKAEKEEARLDKEMKKSMLPQNYQLQTAATQTLDSMKHLMSCISELESSKKEKLERHVEILRNLKVASPSALEEANKELYENLKHECLSVQHKYPHLLHRFCYDSFMYIICKTKCAAIQMPCLFLFPNLGNDGNVLFIVQNDPCGNSEFGQRLKTEFYEQLSTKPILKRNVSSILKTWGRITQMYIEWILKDTL